ncbi:hypothetical protein PG984_009176 [Apiospora sp. TS-2023a]
MLVARVAESGAVGALSRTLNSRFGMSSTYVRTVVAVLAVTAVGTVVAIGATLAVGALSDSALAFGTVRAVVASSTRIMSVNELQLLDTG